MNWTDEDRAELTDLGANIYGALVLKAKANEWRPIESVPIGTKVLILFSRSGHVEDAYFHPCEDGEGVYYTLFDGESMNDQPTHWMPFPALSAMTAEAAK